MHNTSNQPAPTAGLRLPFIAEILMGLFTLGASYLFFQNWFVTLAVVLLAAMLIFRRNVWGISAAVLMTLAIDLFQSQRYEEFRIVMLMLVVGVLAQLLGAFWLRYQLGYWGSSFAENAVFAVLGMLIGFAILFRVCQPIVEQSGSFVLGILAMSLGACASQLIDASAQDFAGQNDIFPFFAAFYWLCFRAALLMPWVWAVIFTSLRASGFAIWQPRRVFRYLWRTGWWTLLMTFVGFAAVLGLAALASLPSLASSEWMNEILPILALATLLTLQIFGAAHGATDRRPPTTDH